ncbi:MAG: ATP-binding cassette domain-containing protein [Saprospiraceae bacterium]
MDIRIENLSKSYGLQKAVNNISFEVKSGEIVGLLGPNGAGKTTTMKMITQYLTPESGKIWIGNKQNIDPSIRKNVGYLPEHNPLYEEMMVPDYLGFCASLQGVDSNKINSRIREMIKVCGLDPEKHKKINELSKGYRQRVGLAQAIIHDPKILILDEPTTGLDPNQIVEIRELIKHLGKEKTVILSTHILPEVEATCDRILIISKGKLVADGTVENLKKQAVGKQILHVKIEGAEKFEILQSLRNLTTIDQIDFVSDKNNTFEIHSVVGENSNREIFHHCVKQNWELLEIIPFETKLEDIFRDLTVK